MKPRYCKCGTRKVLAADGYYCPDCVLKYIKGEMSHTEKDRISTFIEQTHDNPHCLLKAYTVESDFYVKLNRDLATSHFDQGKNFGITFFIDFFYNHPAFKDLSYKGKVYRGMCMTHDDMKQYSVGKKVMNKAFMSTTKNRYVAEQFAKNGLSDRVKQYGGHVKLSSLCVYEILNDRTGLDIESISEYRHEEEVLVGPYSAFIITTIRQIASNYVEIDLRECEGITNENNDEGDDDDFDED